MPRGTLVSIHHRRRLLLRRVELWPCDIDHEHDVTDLTIIGFLDFYAAFNQKMAGNNCYKFKNYKAAMAHYHVMAEYLQMDLEHNILSIDKVIQTSNIQSRVDNLRMAGFKNATNVYIMLEDWGKCIEKCDFILTINPYDGKTMYRRGVANRKLGKFDEALQDILNAMNNPSKWGHPNDQRLMQRQLALLRNKDKTSSAYRAR